MWVVEGATTFIRIPHLELKYASTHGALQQEACSWWGLVQLKSLIFRGGWGSIYGSDPAGAVLRHSIVIVKNHVHLVYDICKWPHMAEFHQDSFHKSSGAGKDSHLESLRVFSCTRGNTLHKYYITAQPEYVARLEPPLSWLVSMRVDMCTVTCDLHTGCIFAYTSTCLWKIGSSSWASHKSTWYHGNYCLISTSPTIAPTCALWVREALQMHMYALCFVPW